MSVTLLRRRPRRPGPEMPRGELSLQEPPIVPEPGGSAASMLTYMPMALGSMAMLVVFIRPGAGGGAFAYVGIGMMSLSAVGMLVSQLLRTGSERSRAMRLERRDYLRHLGQVRRQVRRAIVAQQRAASWQHPATSGLWSLVPTSRLWERRGTDPDFGEVRLASGPRALSLRLVPLSTTPVEDLEPFTAHALRRFINAYETVDGQPVPVYLPGYARIALRGTDDDVTAVVRSLVAQLAVLHSPADVRIAVVADEERRTEWEWVKWLPHALHPDDVDGAGQVRLVVTSAGRLEHLLGEELAGRPAWEPDNPVGEFGPLTIVVVDTAAPVGGRLAAGGYRDVVAIGSQDALGWAADAATLRLAVGGDGLHDGLGLVETDGTGEDATRRVGCPERLGPAAALSLARSMARYRPVTTGVDSAEPLMSDLELTALLDIVDLHGLDVDAQWARTGRSGRLSIPIGVGADGAPVALDIKESAQGGMGPHGLLIGATGSGKSELLRTLVLGLALTHSSETLNFVLTDFKGGATFLGLDRLPHTSAVITNLADEAALVDRMQDALHGELVRRQELLRSAGNYSSVLDYETARADGAPLTPLPSLVVVVDEFSELLASHREFMDLFVMIGRLGRSLGVHLLLASQRLDEGRMTQLESHLSYRIGLRTFSAMESRGVLGVPDAYELPSEPGNGYLKSDTATLTRFKASYVSGEYRTVRRGVEPRLLADQVVPYTTSYVAPRVEAAGEDEPEDVPDEITGTLLSTAVDRLVDAGPPAHRVWLPPLDVAPALDDLMPPLLPLPGRGLGVEVGHGELRVPVGVVDRPFDQARELLSADLSGAGGHVGIAGGPQSGKSTLVRTLIAGLALTHTPREVQCYCLDFGGGALAGLTDLPHVGEVTGRLDPDRVNRLVAEVNGVVARRERLFADHRIASYGDYRKRHRAGEFADDPHGDVFLVVDGWTTLKTDFPDLVPALSQLATRGLNFGVHLVVAATRWGEIATALRDQLGTRFELRLGDPVDSAINMRAAATVPKTAGRGLTPDQLHFLTAVPRIDGRRGGLDLADGVEDLVDAIGLHWDGPKAPPVRMLPSTVGAETLPEPTGAWRLPLGVEENDLRTWEHDFDASPHLVVIGDAETGKTNLLSLVAAQIARRYDPSEARVSLVDVRRQLFDAVPESHQLGYGVTVDNVREIVVGVADAMKARLPGPDVTPARLRSRDWWSGPSVFLIVDDYDLVSGGPASPFAPLLDYLAQGAELGLHVVVARSANGASRATNDPLLRRLFEVNTPTLLLSCPPSEGYIVGSVKPRELVQGRAQLITRRGTSLVQTALHTPAAQAAGA